MYFSAMRLQIPYCVNLEVSSNFNHAAHGASNGIKHNSQLNWDHKHTHILYRRESWCPKHQLHKLTGFLAQRNGKK